MPVSKKWTVLSAAALASLTARYASAQVPIYGPTPLNNTTAGGYTGSAASAPTGGPNGAGANGVVIGNASYYYSAPVSTASRYTAGYVLSSSGTTTQLQLSPNYTSTPAASSTPNTAKSINTNGTLIAGLSLSYLNPNNSTYTNNETVWTSSGTYIPLPEPLTDSFNDPANVSSGFINNSGTVVGTGTVYSNVGTDPSLGTGAFVWTNSGSVASPSYTSYSELLAPQNSTGSISTGSRTETVLGISDSGLAVGSGSAYSGTVSAGTLPVTWDTTSTPTAASSTVLQTTIAPVLLQTPSLSAAQTNQSFGPGTYTYNSASGTGTGTPSAIRTTAQASYINNALVEANNVIAGTATVYNTGSMSATTGAYTAIGTEPVLWNGPGSTGTFLPLTVSSNSSTYISGSVTGINTGGDVVGNVLGTGNQSIGAQTAVLWKYGAGTATGLKAPTGTNPVTGSAYPSTSVTFALGVNNYDYSVGFLATANNQSNSTTSDNALLWDSNGNATDLNSLISLVVAGNGTTAGWVSLLSATSISNSGAIAGLGIYYDPNATNYNTAAISNIPGEYYREFDIQDSAAPEPTSVAALMVVGSAGLLRRRRCVVRARK